MRRALPFVLLFAAASAGAQTSAADSALVRRADHARIEGSATAPVWLIEVSDFQCPYCKRFHDETYPTIKKDYIDAGKVRLAYVNFPLVRLHKNAMAAARAAMCVAAQDRFWPMHDALFASQERWESLSDPAPVFDSLARASGADAKAMDKCVGSGVMNALVDGDMDRAKGIGVTSTPSFKIPGDPQVIAGAQPLELFRQALDAALARAASSPAP